MTTEGGVESSHLIGIVDSNPGQLILMNYHLREAGFRTITGTDQQTALEMFATNNPDLLLIGDDLPGRGTHHLVTAIREFLTVPIMVVGSNTDEDYIVRMLQSGADDYRVKDDITNKILVARVRSLLRRIGTADQNPQPVTVITNAELTVDLLQHEVRIEDEGVHLTPTEFQIVSFLSMHLGQTVPHAKMISKIWGENEDQEPTFVRMQVCRLRSKLERDSHAPNYIVTVWGIGYKMPNLNPPQNGSV